MSREWVYVGFRAVPSRLWVAGSQRRECEQGGNDWLRKQLIPGYSKDGTPELDLGGREGFGEAVKTKVLVQISWGESLDSERSGMRSELWGVAGFKR